MDPELVADTRCECGEGPLWHPDEGRLYWTDIPAGRMFRYDPSAGSCEQFYEGQPVGGFTIQADGALLLFGMRGSVRLWRDGGLSTLIQEIPQERNTRFNDVIADPEGRVFFGTMSGPDGPARLYLLGTDGSLSVVAEGIGTSNGMGFTPDGEGFYHTDTRLREVHLYDYEKRTGAISNRSLFVRAPQVDGLPDGLTVDAEGCIWTARWDGGCIVRYRPDGTEERRIRFPARKVTSLTFAGPHCEDMYVTTAGGAGRTEEGEGAGALFRVRCGVRGSAEFRSRIALT